MLKKTRSFKIKLDKKRQDNIHAHKKINIKASF